MAKSLGSPEWDLFLQMLQEARTSAGLTQQQIADRLQRPQSFVAKVEGGERRLDVIEFCQWAIAVGERPSVFLDKFVVAMKATKAH